MKLTEKQIIDALIEARKTEQDLRLQVTRDLFNRLQKEIEQDIVQGVNYFEHYTGLLDKINVALNEDLAYDWRVDVKEEKEQ